jgi:hypothetical protein
MAMTVRRIVLDDVVGPQKVQMAPEGFPMTATYWRDPDDEGMTVSALVLYAAADEADSTAEWTVTVVRAGDVVPDDGSYVASTLAADGRVRHVFVTPPDWDIDGTDPPSSDAA